MAAGRRLGRGGTGGKGAGPGPSQGPAEGEVCTQRYHVTSSPPGTQTHAHRALDEAALVLVAAAAVSVGRRRWKCHLRLGWPKLRLMALSGIRRQVSWGGRLGTGWAGAGGDSRVRKGPTLFQAALGLRPPSPAVFEAWPSLASAPSCLCLSPSHLLGGAGRGFFS